MKTVKRNKILLLFLTIILAICIYYNSDYYIRKHEWKNSRGASIGDWVEFKDSLYSIKYRKVYKNNSLIGNVVFCFESYLIVYSKDEKEFGYYYKKD
ncbi:MAG: hypothetical protein U0T69_00010 [Chitinophagales bacterium]